MDLNENHFQSFHDWSKCKSQQKDNWNGNFTFLETAIIQWLMLRENYNKIRLIVLLCNLSPLIMEQK